MLIINGTCQAQNVVENKTDLAERQKKMIGCRGIHGTCFSHLWYCAVWCSTVQCSAVQCNTVQCSMVQCSTIQCRTIKCITL